MAFEAMRTQWRVGPAGATGLDYTAIPAVCAGLGVSWPDAGVFDDIRTMEIAALERMHEDK